MLKTCVLSFITFLILFDGICQAAFLMHSHGNITVAPYVHGFDNSRYLYPGYRSEFTTHVDFFSFKRLVFNSLLGNTTIISHQDTAHLKLDRIRYTLIPNLRYEFDRWLIRGALHHECIHRISQPEHNGSIWWNSFQIGVGTRGAYYLYLHEQYTHIKNSFLNSWDTQINIGYILPAKNSLLSGQNHDYRYELFTVIRYHIGVFGKWALFAGVNQHIWQKRNNAHEHQIRFTLNCFRKGTKNFTGFYYTYTIYDTFTLDNADGMGSVGYRILF